MSETRVLAICLTRDREAMTLQAVEAWKRQIYQNRGLLIWDTSEAESAWLKGAAQSAGEAGGISYVWERQFGAPPRTIGEERNAAARWSTSDIICHFDSDDWSHPNRIAEQVALLQSSGADAVGYRQMLFWREPRRMALSEIPGSALNDGATEMCTNGEAWLYTGAICGTSLMYWRRTWERNPFPPVPSGEDLEFLLRAGKVKGVSAMCRPLIDGRWAESENPRMIARIHGQANPAYRPEAMRETAHHWTRVPEFDNHCEGVFAK